MKNLHKKIGAMVLAGMVVLGGVAAGGVNSFAASNNKASKVSKNLGQEREIQRVKFYCKGYGSIIVEKEEKKLNDLLSGYSKRDLYNYGRRVNIDNPSGIPQHLRKAKYSNKKFVKIQYRNLFYLIQVN